MWAKKWEQVLDLEPESQLEEANGQEELPEQQNAGKGEGNEKHIEARDAIFKQQNKREQETEKNHVENVKEPKDLEPEQDQPLEQAQQTTQATLATQDIQEPQSDPQLSEEHERRMINVILDLIERLLNDIERSLQQMDERIERLFLEPIATHRNRRKWSPGN
ncbi:general transcriptional corepressor trfA-like [Scaptodrosophila lebanonensis]|uniref:General transcriptional corepressor trfA-like n=1 Tax=Drosophila lebanonensis TaxID=7225 RepID=A0A6J2TWG5_DROLE|nr:general transcriptional corepressor trfA-like [Scaptodrosophila lebanonensis]